MAFYMVAMSSQMSADTIFHPERGGDGNSSGDGIIFKPLCFSLSSFWVKYDPSTSTTATPSSLANRNLSRFADIDTVNVLATLTYLLGGIFILWQISHLRRAAILWILSGSRDVCLCECCCYRGLVGRKF